MPSETLRHLSRLAICIFVLAPLALSTALGRGRGHRAESDGAANAPGDFDYYLMSLSWSPTFCLTHPNATDQCVEKGFGFVLHGLWPQNRDGSYPQHCASHAEPDAATIGRTLAFMPSETLIVHEWKTHGVCSGLDPRAYFELADRAFASITIPAALTAPATPPPLSAQDIAQAFTQINSGLSADMLAITCSGEELAEVRVCLGKNLVPRACGRDVRTHCRSGVLEIPAVR